MSKYQYITGQNPQQYILVDLDNLLS
jgi:hypothetical protein